MPYIRFGEELSRLDSEMLTTPLDEAMRQAAERGEDVARLHSGDLSIWSALGEQLRREQGAVRGTHDPDPGPVDPALRGAELHRVRRVQLRMFKYNLPHQAEPVGVQSAGGDPDDQIPWHGRLAVEADLGLD